MPWKVVLVHSGNTVPLALPLCIGRSSSSEMAKQEGWINGDSCWSISHKYISRLHLRIWVSDESADDTQLEDGPKGPLLQIRQFGKNPSFLGSKSTVISHGVVISLTPEEALQAQEIAFPRELDLPKIVLTFQPPAPVPVSRGDQQKTDSHITVKDLVLSIPTNGAECDDDDDLKNPAHLPFSSVPGSILDSLTAAKQASFVVIEPVYAAPLTDHAEPFVPSVSEARGTDSYAANVGGLTLGKGWIPTSIAEAPPSVARVEKETASANMGVMGSQDVAPASAAHSRLPTMGFWEWKAYLDGDDKVGRNWKPYKKAVADVLENAFCNPAGQSIVNIDGNYAVCFDDRDVGMVQYRLDDHTRWRPVRRRGGDTVPRQNVKRVQLIYAASDDGSDGEDLGIYAAAKKNVGRKNNKMDSDDDDDYVKDGWLVDDEEEDALDDSDSDSSEDWAGDSSMSSLTASSSDADEKRKRKIKKKGKKL